MNYIDITAKTVEEAIDQGIAAIEEKGFTFERSEVVQAPSKGIFGIGKKDAIVRVYANGDAFPSVDIQAVEEAVTEGLSEEDGRQWTDKVDDQADAAAEEAPEIPMEQVRTYEEPVEEEEKAEVAPSTSEVSDPKVQEEMAENGKRFLADLFAKMHLEVVIEKMRYQDRIVYQVHGDNVGVLIGKHGQTLDAIQYLTNLVVNKGQTTRCHVVVDVEGYRQRRERTLQQLAKRMADKVRRTRRRVSLEPMNAYERKIIHMALQDAHDIVTSSEGEGTYRHVVVELKR